MADPFGATVNGLPHGIGSGSLSTVDGEPQPSFPRFAKDVLEETRRSQFFIPANPEVHYSPIPKVQSKLEDFLGVHQRKLPNRIENPANGKG